MRLEDALRDPTFAEDLEDAARLVEEQPRRRPWDEHRERRHPPAKPPRGQHGTRE